MPAFGAATSWMGSPEGRSSAGPLRPRRVPLLMAALAFAGGIVLARQWHDPASLVLSLLLLLLLAGLAVPRAPAVGWLGVLTLWCGAGCWCAQLQAPVGPQLSLTSFADGLSRTVRGRVVAVQPLSARDRNADTQNAPTAPWLVETGGWEGETGDPAATVDVAVEAVEQVTPDVSTLQPVTGGLRLTLPGGAEALRCGDLIEVPVRLRIPEVYRDPGAFSYRDWLLGQGMGALGSTKAGKLQVLSAGTGEVRCRMKAAQLWAAKRLERLPGETPIRRLPGLLRLTDADTAMLAAMLFGDRTALSTDLRAGFERTGTFHLFVVSGLHIALFTGTVFWLLRRQRVPQGPAVALTVTLAFGYALLTGFGVPAQRALAMSSLYLIARALDRERSGLNALGAAALLLLAASPRALFEPSFQMTSLVILAVAGLGSPVTERLLGRWRAAVGRLDRVELDAFLPPVVAARRVRLRMWGAVLGEISGYPWVRRAPVLGVQGCLLVAEGLLFSAAIELCMALPMALYFHRAMPLAMPANLLVAPLASLLAAAGVLTFAGGLVSPWLAAVPGAFAATLLRVIRAVVDCLGHATVGDLRVPPPPAASIVLFCCLLAFACWALREHRRALGLSGALAAALLLVVVLWPVRARLHPQVLEVTALDVGQGDSLLVVSPEGQTLLVDAGGPVGRVSTRWDVGEEVVAPYLWSRHLRRLDAVVITHAHSDHIGGMPAVLRDLRPRELWLGVQPADSDALRALLLEARQLGVVVHPLAAGDHFHWGGMDAAVLAPEPGYRNPGQARNDDSLVMRLDWQRASVLLEGDAELPSEDAMLAHGRLAPVTLLKVGHHGSRTSTNPAFLSAVAPHAAVISVGQHNTFGHPRGEVLERLQTAHVQTFRTDREGAVTFLLHPDGSLGTEAAYN